MKHQKLLITLAIIIGFLGSSVGGFFLGRLFSPNPVDLSKEPYNPPINPSDFVTNFSNPYFPLIIGQSYIYEGTETVNVTILNETKLIMGIQCIVVRDTVTIQGEIIEDTFDWYAQDRFGNIWYMGEDTKEYKNGEVVSTAGSWEGGVDGAKPGIIMLAHPLAGIVYRQEYYLNEAEDFALIISLNETVTVTYGTFSNCVKTRERSALEPGIYEYKYYASGIGFILQTAMETNLPVIQLSNIIIT